MRWNNCQYKWWLWGDNKSINISTNIFFCIHKVRGESIGDRLHANTLKEIKKNIFSLSREWRRFFRRFCLNVRALIKFQSISVDFKTVAKSIGEERFWSNFSLIYVCCCQKSIGIFFFRKKGLLNEIFKMFLTNFKFKMTENWF